MSDLLDMTPKAKQQNEKIDNLGFIKIYNFCAWKDPINRVKRQPKKWENILANDVSDKRLISRIYK